MNYAHLIILTFLSAVTSTALHGQPHFDPDHLQCPQGDGLIRSRVLHDDSLSTSTLLCISNEVRPHIHAQHTEHVAVLEGEATMLLGDSIFTIGPGSYVAIPAGTRHAVRVLGTVPFRVISVQSPRFDGSDRIFVDPGADWSHP